MQSLRRARFSQLLLSLPLPPEDHEGTVPSFSLWEPGAGLGEPRGVASLSHLASLNLRLCSFCSGRWMSPVTGCLL